MKTIFHSTMKSYISNLLTLVLFGSLNLIVSCQGSCEDGVAYYRPQKCSIIVKDISPGRPFKIKGPNVYTGSEDRYSDQGGWFVQWGKHIEIGDTVIKRENEMMFYIRKRDTTMAIPYDCQGKIYQ